MLARGAQQLRAVRLALHEGGAVHQGLRRVPDDVADRLLGVDPEQVLQDGEEGDLLRRVLHPVVHGVEDVQVAGEVDIVGPAGLRLVALLLLLEHVELHPQVGVLALRLDVAHDLQQLQADELVPQSVPVLELGCGDDQAVDERQQHSPVLTGPCQLQLLHHHPEPVPARLEVLVVVEGLECPGVTLGVVDAERREELEHLALHLHRGGVQG